MRTGLVCMTLVALVVSAGTATAAKKKPEPEYQKLKLHAGMSLEVEGQLNEAGLFVAEDLTPLEEARKPKLRAPIQAIDRGARTIQVLGMTIQVRDDTEFDGGSFDDLKTGQHIEVKSSVREGGWKASSIETLNVKPGVKVKVTVTRVFADGVPPDTLDCSGFLILLTEEADVNEESRRPDSRERRLFRDLAHDDAGSFDHGVPLAHRRVHLAAEYRHKWESNSDQDLSPSFESDTEDTEPQLRLMAAFLPSQRFRFLGQLRARQNFVVDSPEGGGDSEEIKLEVLQLVALARDIGGAPVAVQAGRQRYKEPREWLYDDYLDAVRVSVYPWQRFSFEASVIDGRNSYKDKFQTWTDALGMLTAGVYGGLASAYVWKRWDSDEARKREPLWAGVRYRGGSSRWLQPWGELAAMRGEDKHRNLDAWAFDVGATARASTVPLQPSVTVGYAVGSGNPIDGDADDHRFRQSGFEDNTARMNGLGLVRYYGAGLEPELSNITIFTAGAGFCPLPYLSIEAIYHHYVQHHPADEVRGRLVDPPARPNGVDPQLGDGVDVVTGLYNVWNHVSAVWTLAWFLPGAAFAPREQTAFLNRIELRFEL